MTYYSYKDYKPPMQSYEFTAFAEADLLQDGDHNLGCGDTFTMPGSATTCITVTDDDDSLSGDNWRNEHANDSRGQTATIEGPGGEEGNGGQIYAESYYWVSDQYGNWYVLIEIEQEGSNADYFSFYTGGCYSCPPAGAELTVHSKCNVKGDWLNYDEMGCGDKAPATGSISGTVFCDTDCDGEQEITIVTEKGDNLLKDSTFENGDHTDYNVHNYGHWYDAGSGSVDIINGTKKGHNGNDPHNEIVELDKGGIWCQNFNVTAAGTYCLTFDVYENSHLTPADNSFNVKINGMTIETVSVTEDGQVVLEVQLEAGNNRIDFASLSYVKGKGAGIDNIELRQEITTEVYEEPTKEGVTVKLIDATTGDVVATTVTDVDGNYSFDDVPVGDYKIMGVAPDGTEFTIKDGAADDVDSDVDASGMSDVITVTADSETDIDLGLCEKPTGEIGGRYFCDVDRDAVDNSEPGVSGATVWLLDAAGCIIDMTTTDANGDYCFEELEAGTYSVRFQNPDNVAGGNEVGKTFVAANVGNDDDDSDVESVGGAGNGNTAQIVLGEGESKKNVDAGILEPLGSLSGRYFCDDDRDGLDNDGADNGIGGVTVELLDEDGNPTGRTTTTDANGNYAFTGLVAGLYGVKFTDTSGKILTTQNVDGDASDDIDSDAGDLGGGMSQILNIPVVAGENTPDNDAGVFPNEDPVAVDDMGKGCADELIFVDLLANDFDNDGDTLSVVSISDADETVGVGGTITLDDGAMVTLNADGTVTVDGIAAYADLEIGDKATDSFTYVIEDGQGGTSAAANVDIMFCGAKNTVDTIADILPTGGTFELGTFTPANAENGYTGIFSGTGDARLDGMMIEETYCIDSALDFATVTPTEVDLYVANEANALAIGLSASAAANIDLVNWIINQDFTSQDNGDGNGLNFTDAEVQDAIWTLMNGAPNFLDNPLFGTVFTENNNGVRDNGEKLTQENIDDIVLAAQTAADAEGFVPGEGQLVGLLVDPNDPALPDQQQPFIVAVQFDDWKQDCICL